MNDHDDTEANYSAADPFLVALQLCSIATNAKSIAPALKRLRKLGRDIEAAERKLAAVQDQAAALVANAKRDVKTIHEAAAQRLEAVAVTEEELAQREQKIARLEGAWKYIGEPADVMSGFRSPEHTPLQKARLGHGQQPGKDPDLLFSEPDAAPAMRIDSFSDTSDDPAADRQGAPFIGGLTRDVSHKRKSAA